MSGRLIISKHKSWHVWNHGEQQESRLLHSLLRSSLFWKDRLFSLFFLFSFPLPSSSSSSSFFFYSSSFFLLLPSSSLPLPSSLSDNVERVERDEEAHAALEKEREAKRRQAEGEARLSLLRKRAKILRGEKVADDDDDDDLDDNDAHRNKGGEAEVFVQPAAKKRLVEAQEERLDLLGDAQNFEEMLLGGSKGVAAGSRRLNVSSALDSESRVYHAYDWSTFGLRRGNLLST